MGTGRRGRGGDTSPTLRKPRPWGYFCPWGHFPQIPAAGKGTGAGCEGRWVGPFIPNPGGDPPAPHSADKGQEGAFPPKPGPRRSLQIGQDRADPNWRTNLQRVAHLRLPGHGGPTRITALEQATNTGVVTTKISQPSPNKGRGYQGLATESQTGVKKHFNFSIATQKGVSFPPKRLMAAGG